VETNTALRIQILEGHEQQIQILDFVLKKARTGIDAIEEQSQQIIARATEEFNKIMTRIESCEQEQTQLKVKQASLTIFYTTLHKRITALKAYTKNNVPDYQDLRKITDTMEDIADQTMGLMEAHRKIVRIAFRLFPAFTGAKANLPIPRRDLSLKVGRTLRLSASFRCVFPFTQIDFPIATISSFRAVWLSSFHRDQAAGVL
jgi:hypothetical protein